LTHSQFETLLRVSQVLARAVDCSQSLREVLRALEITGHLSRGMLGVVDPDAGDLSVHLVHGLEHEEFQAVRYQAGEGLLGRILESGRSCAVVRLGDEPRFLNRLGLLRKRPAVHRRTDPRRRHAAGRAGSAARRAGRWPARRAHPFCRNTGQSDRPESPAFGRNDAG
jgi:hypothetical protein